jgi:hypothetical protein
MKNLNQDEKLRLSLAGLAFAKSKTAISLLTLRNEPDAIFLLKDEDWIKFSGFEINNRPSVEAVLRDSWSHFSDLWRDS